jgi:hypothetical protein
MRKKIEEIKTFQNKTTYSHYSKQIKGVFKTIGIESFIKKYEDLQKLKNKNNQIKKISVSDFLDQLDKEKQMNLLKDNKRKFFKSRISVKNKYIDIHKYDDEIDIFSKNYSPPKYIKPNIIRIKKINEKQKLKSKSLLEKNKYKCIIPPIGKYNINYKVITKHIPSFSFNNSKNIKSSNSISGNEKNKFRIIHSEKDEPSIKNLKHFIWNKNVKFNFNNLKIKNLIRENSAKNINLNKFFKTYMNRKWSRNLKKTNNSFNILKKNNSCEELNKINYINDKKNNILKKKHFSFNVIKPGKMNIIKIKNENNI